MGKRETPTSVLKSILSGRTIFLFALLSLSTLAMYVASMYLSFLPLVGGVSANGVNLGGSNSNSPSRKVQVGAQTVQQGGGMAALGTVTALEEVMGQYGSRLSHDTWLKKLEGGESAPPPPIFFITSSRSGGKQSPGVASKREEQYASNIGGILALGYQVYLTVTPTGGQKWELIEALVAAASPGQLRVHYCSNATRVSARTAGPDETLCMQESIESFFGGCLTLGEPSTLVTPAPPCCPSPNTHVIRMSGRYLMAKYHLLHAIWSRGKDVDAFVKWGPVWSEPTVTAQQVYTFFLSLKVSYGRLWFYVAASGYLPSSFYPLQLSLTSTSLTPTCPLFISSTHS